MEVEKPRVETAVRRKLTTILASDVASYTRLMRDDEEATLRTLSEYREIIDGLIERHDGRIFSTAGDSVLAEFSSTVEAVRCAVAFQEEITARNRHLPKDRGLHYRIGINVGDVMAKGEILYGDGINVAARLEGLAEPGGICLSGAAWEQVRHKISLGVEDLGPQALKNIAEPVPAYRLVSGATGKKPAAKAKPAAEERGRRGFRIPFRKTLAVAAVAVIAVSWSKPSVRDMCGPMDYAARTLLHSDSAVTLTERAKLQDSWSWRLNKLWSKARQELCW